MTDVSNIKPSLEQRVHEDDIRLFLAHHRGSLVAITLVTIAVAVAGRDYVPLRSAVLWCAAACLNYLGQGIVSYKLERAESSPPVTAHWMRWLLASVAFSGIVWGSVPWLLSSSVQVLLFANLFNVMLITAVLSHRGPRAMYVAAAVPMAILSSAALLVRGGFPYLALGAAVAFGVILLNGMRVQSAIQAMQRERYVAKDLAEELRLNQQSLIAVEHERTLLLERQRMMRDMHDGMGSTLLASLAAVEQGQLDAKGMAQLLRDCIEDLRLVIDSLEPLDHDLVTLLATLRYRLADRMEAAGIRLEWNMPDLPALPWLKAPQALQILRIVQGGIGQCDQACPRHARAHYCRDVHSSWRR